MQHKQGRYSTIQNIDAAAIIPQAYDVDLRLIDPR
jgi:hypothetical protein